jgi:hypothetical protein
MSEAMMIPVLPCASLPETLAFYRALGFEVTHEQTKPNVYAATSLGGVNLHFMGIKGLAPKDAYTTCLVIVPDVERLHHTFADRLKNTYGKLPVAGFPRISRIRKGESRFTVVDVDGNSVVYIKRDAPDDYEEGDAKEPASKLERSMRMAARLRDFKNDDHAAAKVLDVALARTEEAPALERARAIVARLELAVVLEEHARAKSLRAELDGLSLAPKERRFVEKALKSISA